MRRLPVLPTLALLVLALAVSSARAVYTPPKAAQLFEAHLASRAQHNTGLYPAHLSAAQHPLVRSSGAGALYRKETRRIATPDGVELNTVAFIPLDLDNGAAIGKKFDTVMFRTPYGVDGLKGEGETYVKQGFAVVMQDFRGMGASSGEFSGWLYAGRDGATTVAWIKEQPWSTGVIFGQGTSANGIATYLEQSIMPPPDPRVLRAQGIIVGSGEIHRTLFQGGAYRYSLFHGWLAGIKQPGFETNFTTREGYSSYYSPVSMTDKWGEVTAPAVHITGWYDIFNQQQLDAFEAYTTKSVSPVRDLNFAVVLPTGHCPGGQVVWPNWADGVALGLGLMVELYKALKVEDAVVSQAAKAKLAATPIINWYVMGPGMPGTKGNYWTSAATWPTATNTSLYLAANRTLSTAPVAESGNATFTYDPADPVPTLGGNNLLLPKCGPWDQSSLEKRPDVVSFTLPPLTATMALTGHMYAELFVSSNRNDTDITVKVLDVFPNGTTTTALMIQDGIQRLKWRNSPSTPSPLVPGQVYPITVDVWSTSYIFNVGHSIRIDISSSNFPRFSANPNTGLPLATPNQTPLVAENTIHVGGEYPSRLILPVVAMDDLPQVDLKPHIERLLH